jgi:hypothetical protein
MAKAHVEFLPSFCGLAIVHRIDLRGTDSHAEQIHNERAALYLGTSTKKRTEQYTKRKKPFCIFVVGISKKAIRAN